MDLDINKKKHNKVANKKTFQPMLYVIGKSITAVNQYIVFYDEARYFFDEPIAAFTSYYAIHFSLGLSYQAESLEVWQLVQLAFYQMEYIVEKSTKNKKSLQVSDKVKNLVEYFMKK